MRHLRPLATFAIVASAVVLGEGTALAADHRGEALARPELRSTIELLLDMIYVERPENYVIWVSAEWSRIPVAADEPMFLSAGADPSRIWGCSFNNHYRAW